MANLVVALDEPTLQVVRVTNSIHDNSQPPSYDEVVDTEPPPCYDSIYSKVKQARDTSDTSWDYFSRVFVLLRTAACTILLHVTVILPISMVIMGVMYLHDCPQGKYIPVYLLVGGMIGILKQLLHLSARVREGADAVSAERVRQSRTQAILNCFMFCWFIIGSIWVYNCYEPNYDSTQRLYCNKTLYLFAFWLTTSIYLLVALAVICLCLIMTTTLVCQL